jgi:hypothetical protein
VREGKKGVVKKGYDEGGGSDGEVEEEDREK